MSTLTTAYDTTYSRLFPRFSDLGKWSVSRGLYEYTLNNLSGTAFFYLIGYLFFFPWDLVNEGCQKYTKKRRLT